MIIHSNGNSSVRIGLKYKLIIKYKQERRWPTKYHRLPRSVYVQRMWGLLYKCAQSMETVKRSGLLSSLSSHGHHIFCPVASVFTVVAKLGMMKVWHFSWIWPWRSCSIAPKRKVIITELCVTSGSNWVIPAWTSGELSFVKVQNEVDCDFKSNLTLMVRFHHP